MLRTIWQIVPTLRLLALILPGLQCAPGLADNVMAELEVVKVMERRGTIPGFGGADVALLDNRDDTVLVLATNGNDEPGLFLYDGPYTAVVSAGQVLPGAPGPFTGYSIAGVMNATTVVFLGSFANGGSAIYRYDRASGHYTPVVASGAAVPGGSGHFSAFFGLAVDDDRVIFMATATDGSRGIYRWDGALTPLVDYTTTVPGGTGSFSFFTGLAARDGIVAIGGRDAAGMLGIYRSADGGPLTRVADTTTTVPGTTETFEHLDVSGIHDGEVYFTGFGGFVAGLYGGVQATITVVDTRQPMPGAFGPFDCCFGTVHRSAPGTHYFRGTNFATTGIYLARDGKIYRIIDSDEPLDGTRLDYLQPSGGWSGAQSSNGRIYFETTGGIYAAHPSFAPAPAAAPRITLGFEDLDLAEGAPVTGIPGVAGLTLEGARLVRPAPPDTAFPGDDAGTGDMLTAPSPNGALLRIIFDAPVREVTLDIANILSSWTWPWPRVTLQAYDADIGGTLLETIVATRTAPLYGVDDAVVPVDFSFGFAGVERIRRIEIRGPVATTLPGYAIDNLAYASDGFGNGENTDHVRIPVPLWATLVGLAGLGLIGWRHVDRAAARPG